VGETSCGGRDSGVVLIYYVGRQFDSFAEKLEAHLLEKHKSESDFVGLSPHEPPGIVGARAS